MSLSHSPRIVTKGLVLCLDAGDPKSYNGSGTIWYDRSKSGFVFTSITPPTFTTGINNQPCFDFTNGSGQYFESTTNSPFSGNNFAISVMAVVNQNTIGTYHAILSQNEQDVDDSMAFISNNGKFATDIWRPAGRRLITAADTNTMYNVAWIVEDWSLQKTNAKIYLNGVVQPTESYGSASPNSLVSDTLRIGNWQLDRSDMDFDGQIYQILVYNRALTEKEIIQNYNATKGRFGL